MKKTLAFLMTACMTLSAAAPAFAETAGNTDDLIELNCSAGWMYCDAARETFYWPDGSRIQDMTARVQTAGYEGVLYTVDLDKMQVTAPDGTVNEALTAALPAYLAFRPLELGEYGGWPVSFGEHGKQLLEEAPEILKNLPLTYTFDAEMDDFTCRITVENGAELGGMYYSFDAADEKEPVPWHNEAVLESHQYQIRWKLGNEGSVTYNLLDGTCVGYLQSEKDSMKSSDWPTAEEAQRGVQPKYVKTVDVNTMQAYSPDGTLSEAYTALLNRYFPNGIRAAAETERNERGSMPLAFGTDDALVIALEYDKMLIGDLDENEKVNVGDAVLLARFLANDPNIKNDITAQGLANSDVNRDGSTSPDDLSALLKIIANAGR